MSDSWRNRLILYLSVSTCPSFIKVVVSIPLLGDMLRTFSMMALSPDWDMTTIAEYLLYLPLLHNHSSDDVSPFHVLWF